MTVLTRNRESHRQPRETTCLFLISLSLSLSHLPVAFHSLLVYESLRKRDAGLRWEIDGREETRVVKEENGGDDLRERAWVEAQGPRLLGGMEAMEAAPPPRPSPPSPTRRSRLLRSLGRRGRCRRRHALLLLPSLRVPPMSETLVWCIATCDRHVDYKAAS